LQNQLTRRSVTWLCSLLATLKQQVQIKKWWILLVVLLGWKSKMLQLQAEQLVSTFTDFVCVCVCVCVPELRKVEFWAGATCGLHTTKGIFEKRAQPLLKSQGDTQHENPDLCTSLF
jgi:hypothetical protein